jgi:hypothetical protein
MLKTLIYFPPEYRDLAHKIRENYIEHHHGEVDLVSETDQIGIEYAGEIWDRKRDRIGRQVDVRPYPVRDRCHEGSCQP